MSIRNLDRVFTPKSIAVIGASNSVGKVGHTVLHNIVSGGYVGTVYPVNAKSERVQNLEAYQSVTALPHTPDLAVIATPATTVPGLVRECAERGLGGAVILTAGFREIGSSGMALEQQLRDELKHFPAFRVVGPNCLGIINPHIRLSASFAIGMPRAGQVAFLSQSGALCTAVLDWALAKQLGFSHFVSLGNQLDIGFADLLDFLADDPATSSAALYIESISDSRKFMSAARAFARKKPIIAYKAGRFSESAKAAASHTGAMAGVDEVYQAAFDRAGIVRVFDLQSLFQSAELLSQQEQTFGPRLAIVTNAGGPGVMAVDTLLECNGKLAELSSAIIEQLDQFLPHNWSRANPVDVIGDADADRFIKAVEVTLQDPGVDTVLAILAPQSMTNPRLTAERLVDVKLPPGKALMASWMGGVSMFQAREILQGAGIANFGTPEQAVRGLMTLNQFASRRQVLYETPRDIPLSFQNGKPEREAVLDHSPLQEDRIVLTEVQSKQLLMSYGIPTTEIRPAGNAEAAVAIAQEIGFPVVMKIYSPQITHKTDVDGVALNLKTEDEVRNRFATMTQRAREMCPDADIWGVTIQPMVTAVNAMELILGAKRDPIFGTVIMIGLGGVTAELFKDRSLELPPVNERLIMRMLTQLRCWPLLTGYRGRARIDTDRLVELVLRFSVLIVEQRDIVEMDINPILIGQDLLMALDARVVLASKSERTEHPFDHLAIRPYPDEFQTSIQLADGSRVRLRPIRPEDENHWREMLERCSNETIEARFGYLFKEVTREMATRFCFLDYDRELAIVAEVEVDNQRQIVGVGRMVAGSDRRRAEYALLVEDAWQNRGLGNQLTQHCAKIAKAWRVQELVAETQLTDFRMVAIMRRLGFDTRSLKEERAIRGTLKV